MGFKCIHGRESNPEAEFILRIQYVVVYVSYSCQLLCWRTGALCRALFIFVTTSSWFSNDPKIVGADVITPNPMDVLLSGNLNMHFINGTRLRAGVWHSWELWIWGPQTWHHLESISSCFFCFWSSCKRLRSAAFSSVCIPRCIQPLLVRPAVSLGAGWCGSSDGVEETRPATACLLKWVRRGIQGSSCFTADCLCFPVLHCLEPLVLCAELPRESCKEE